MNADIEALVLSGELFNGTSHSPERSPSPDAGWHDDEITPEIAQQQEAEEYGESIGMGPGRTGVKGVIRDRNESERYHREKREREIREVQELIEKSHVGARTFLEEEREKGLDEKVDELIRREREAAGERRKDLFGQAKEGRFGHLREVGIGGFLAAVEKEDRGVWVVIHLYDSSLERCYLIDESLARLARLHPHTKFLRSRASALGFTSKKQATFTRVSFPNRVFNRNEDEDDEDEDEKDDNGEGSDDNDSVDLDMLPTILVYREGELVRNWVRVDWEAGRAGIEQLLERHHIIPSSETVVSGEDNLGFPSDEDEDDSFDLILSDDDDSS